MIYRVAISKIWCLWNRTRTLTVKPSKARYRIGTEKKEKFCLWTAPFIDFLRKRKEIANKKKTFILWKQSFVFCVDKNWTSLSTTVGPAFELARFVKKILLLYFFTKFVSFVHGSQFLFGRHSLYTRNVFFYWVLPSFNKLIPILTWFLVLSFLFDRLFYIAISVYTKWVLPSFTEFHRVSRRLNVTIISGISFSLYFHFISVFAFDILFVRLFVTLGKVSTEFYRVFFLFQTTTTPIVAGISVFCLECQLISGFTEFYRVSLRFQRTFRR